MKGRKQSTYVKTEHLLVHEDNAIEIGLLLFRSSFEVHCTTINEAIMFYLKQYRFPSSAVDVGLGSSSDLGCGVRKGAVNGFGFVTSLMEALEEVEVAIFSFSLEIGEEDRELADSDDLTLLWTGDTNGFFNVPPEDDCKS